MLCITHGILMDPRTTIHLSFLSRLEHSLVRARVQGISFCIYTLTSEQDILISNHLGYPPESTPQCNTIPLVFFQSVVVRLKRWPHNSPIVTAALGMD